MGPRISVVFAGQGSQSPGMGSDLARISRRAGEVFRQADKLSARYLSGGISQLCFDAPLSRLTSCTNCQPAIFATSLACYEALQELHPFRPAAAAGLSLGEYAALTASQALSFADALELVCHRGMFMDECCQRNRGRMAAVLGESEEDVRALCAKYDLDIANLNCPGQVIISGPADSLARLEDSLTGEFPKVVFLTVDGAYHSRLMKPAADRFREFAARFRLRRPQCLLAQNRPGDFCDDPGTIRENLVAQIHHTVRWEDCMRRLMRVSDLVIEFGPGHVLSGLSRRIDRAFPALTVSSADSLQKTLKELQDT